MFQKILIANRGEIACRIMRTAQALGIRCVAVYSDADAHALHVKMADEAWHLGAAPAAESYLRTDKILNIAKASGAEAIHPGYGFLSENPDFVTGCIAAGLVFIGPSAATIQAMGLKDAAKRLMQENGITVIPGYHGHQQQADYLAEQAEQIGYPVLIKARAGGGGKGMRRVDSHVDFQAALAAAQREAKAAFGDDQVLLEKYITSPRHIEIQIIGDQHGNIVHLFERDCTLQRRHQKVIEEAPAPDMTPAMREAMGNAAIKAAQAVNYVGVGTVEFIVDAKAGLSPASFYFMEMNTRLQVEHPITEAITGLDLVEWQLRIACGETLPWQQTALRIHGHAFEARIYAEDASKGFLPAIGKLHYLSLPNALARIDAGVVSGDDITPFYDPMLAKLIVHGADRHAALNQLIQALQHCKVAGCVTNTAFLAHLANHPAFRAGKVDTGFIERELAQLLPKSSDQSLAMALAAWVAAQPIAPDTDPWSQLPSWSQWNGMQQYIDLQVDETNYTLTVALEENHWLITKDTEQHQLTIQDYQPQQTPQALRFVSNGRMLTAQVLAISQTLTVWLDGQTYHFIRPDDLAVSQDEKSNAHQVIAPMPGQVKVMNTQVGETVTAHQVLLVMEAMKMELALRAPRDGIIENILVQVGDQITEGHVLLQLEETL